MKSLNHQLKSAQEYDKFIATKIEKGLDDIKNGRVHSAENLYQSLLEVAEKAEKESRNVA